MVMGISHSTDAVTYMLVGDLYAAVGQFGHQISELLKLLFVGSYAVQGQVGENTLYFQALQISQGRDFFQGQLVVLIAQTIKAGVQLDMNLGGLGGGLGPLSHELALL